MGKYLFRTRTTGLLPVSDARRKIDAALQNLHRKGTLQKLPRVGRLIFGLDLTQSREHGLKRARIATTAMFQTVKAVGAVALKLIYFRGQDECRESQWCDDPEILNRSMSRLSCESGHTQITKLLLMALAEEKPISGVVYVGDHCEETSERLIELARRLGRKSVPLFMFHECADHDDRSLKAKPIFKRMAEASGGVYEEFKPDSGEVLREMLSNVAAFSAGGTRGVERLATPKTPEARRLQGRLLLGSGGDRH